MSSENLLTLKHSSQKISSTHRQTYLSIILCVKENESTKTSFTKRIKDLKKKHTQNTWVHLQPISYIQRNLMGKAMENATVIVFPGLNSLAIYTSKGYVASKEYLSAKQQLIFIFKTI